MSKEFNYDKIVKGSQLHNELTGAGYLVETVYSKYNSDNPELSEPYCRVVLDDAETKDPTPIVDAYIPGQLTDKELVVEAIELETVEANDQAMKNYLDWDTLTLPQKIEVLKMLVGDFIGRHKENYI